MCVMDIRRLWLTLMEGLAPQRSRENERMRVICRVLKQLRGRERALLNLQATVSDDEQRADLADKLSVLRAQRAKGIRVLRKLRMERRTGTRQASGAGAGGPQAQGARSQGTDL